MVFLRRAHTPRQRRTYKLALGRGDQELNELIIIIKWEIQPNLRLTVQNISKYLVLKLLFLPFVIQKMFWKISFLKAIVQPILISNTLLSLDKRFFVDCLPLSNGWRGSLSFITLPTFAADTCPYARAEVNFLS